MLRRSIFAFLKVMFLYFSQFVSADISLMQTFLEMSNVRATIHEKIFAF